MDPSSAIDYRRSQICLSRIYTLYHVSRNLRHLWCPAPPYSPQKRTAQPLQYMRLFSPGQRCMPIIPSTRLTRGPRPDHITSPPPRIFCRTQPSFSTRGDMTGPPRSGAPTSPSLRPSIICDVVSRTNFRASISCAWTTTSPAHLSGIGGVPQARIWGALFAHS
ncbi:hypothetical protein BC834DRAFT_861161, partial [Gloeopeniophorella convolvens]